MQYPALRRFTLCFLGMFGLFQLYSVVEIHSKFRADPTDDFSFTFARSYLRHDSFDLMSEERLSEVFASRLKQSRQSDPVYLGRLLSELCRQYRFDPAFVLSLIEVESHFRAKVISPAGAMGLMQLMPATGKKMADLLGMKNFEPEQLLEPEINLRLGVGYLAYLRDRYSDRSPYYHVAAYNIGPTKLDRLMKKPSFKPDKTKTYYEKIRRGVPGIRYQGKRDRKSPEIKPRLREPREPRAWIDRKGV
jgi:soluble lytic murein transglycosylase-like protein